jgi:ribosome-associated protein
LKTLPSLRFAKLAAAVADEKIGQDIVILDVRGQTAVSDFFVFVGATSHLHVKSLEDSIRERLKGEGATLLRTDGQRGHLWRVLDYGSMLVHIMEQKTREFYGVERLWDQGKRVAAKAQKEKKPRKAAKRKTPAKRSK